MNVTDRLSPSSRTLVEKWLPVLLAVGIVWLLARGLKNLFWTGFGLFWAFWWTGHWFLR